MAIFVFFPCGNVLRRIRWKQALALGAWRGSSMEKYGLERPMVLVFSEDFKQPSAINSMISVDRRIKKTHIQQRYL